MSLKHGFESAIVSSADSSKLRPVNWGSTETDYDTDPTHVFHGGAHGSLLTRSTLAVDGMTWIAAAAGVLTCSGAAQAPAFSMSPALTSVVLGGVTVNATNAAYLSGITPGTVAASKALVVDANKDLASLRNLTATGTVTIGTAGASPPPLEVFRSTGPQARFAGNATGPNDAFVDFAADNVGRVTYGRVGIDVRNAGGGGEAGGLFFSTVRSGTLRKSFKVGSADAECEINQDSTTGILINGLANGNPPIKVYGVDRGAPPGPFFGLKYVTMLHDGSNPGIRTNCFISINGADGDPPPLAIGGESTYMLGIGSDVGASPTVVIRTHAGPFFKFFSITDVLLGSMDATAVLDLPGYKAAGETGLTQTVDTSTNPTLRFRAGLLVQVS